MNSEHHDSNSGSAGHPPGGKDRKFPVHLLPQVLQEAINELSSALGIQPTLPAVCALATVSAALGKGLWLRHPVFGSTPPNLFFIAVAPSGQFKTTTFRYMCGPLQKFQQERAKAFQHDVLPRLWARCRAIEAKLKPRGRNQGQCIPDGEAEGLYREKNALEEQMVVPTILCEDATSEGLARYLPSGGGALALFSDDARKVFANISGRYQGQKDQTDEQIYLKTYSVSDLLVHRAKAPAKSITEASMVVLLMVQPDKFNELISKEQFVEGGFLPRFLLAEACAESEQWYTEQRAINEECFSNFNGLVSRLLETYRFPEIRSYVECSPFAKDKIRVKEYVTALHQKKHPASFAPFLSRWAENFCRLAVVLHAAEHGGNAHSVELSEATAEAAYQVADWFCWQQLGLLEGMREKKQHVLKDKMVELLQRKGPMKIRAICAHRVAADKAEAELILKGLESEGIVALCGEAWALRVDPKLSG